MFDAALYASIEARPAVAADLPTITAIARASLPERWDEDDFRTALQRDEARVDVARGGSGEILGFIDYWIVVDEMEVHAIAVAPQHRGRKVGSAILRAALERCDRLGVARCFLEVREHNTAALALYCRQGFVEVGRRRGYYDGGQEDALILARDAQPGFDREPLSR